MKLRIGTWNLHEGGLDGDHARPTRLSRQIDLLAAHKLDLLGLQEATWGPSSSRLLHHLAHNLGMTGRTVASSHHHGHDLAILVRERRNPELRLAEEHHDTSGAYWHALARVRLYVDGIDGLGEIDFLNAHLAPSSAGRRADEAETFGLFKNRPTIAVGDFNAAATCDDPDTTGIGRRLIDGKLDTRAAHAMAQAGFHDTGALANDPTPTVGHDPDKLAYRCDRILFANLHATVTDYHVIPAIHPTDRMRLSDHDLVITELDITADTTADTGVENTQHT